MQTAGAFGAALVALTALLVLLLLLTALRKALRGASDRRRERLEATVRPALLRYLAADDPDQAVLEPARLQDHLRRRAGLLDRGAAQPQGARAAACPLVAGARRGPVAPQDDGRQPALRPHRP